MKLTSTNPSKNYQAISSVESSTPEGVKAAVVSAHRAKKDWRALGVDGRVKLMRALTQKLDEYRDKIAELTAQEMGMPITQAQEDFDYAIEYLNAYCDQAAEALKSEVTLQTDTEIHEVFYEPYGVAACIVPWNFPLNNWVWQCGQNLIAGNCIVFKHSEETQLCGKLISDIVNEVLPEGVFTEVYGDGSVGEELVKQDINLTCFTGSTATGAKINELAASCFIPTVMELGGSAPGIVFEDADIDDVIDYIYDMRFSNCGQMCDALKRLIVHESKFSEVVAKLSIVIKDKTLGDASDKQTDVGPLVAQRQLELLEDQMKDALDKGAKVVVGGKRPDGLQGAYYEPTIITDIKPDMRVWQEEVFGPVLPVVAFSDEDKAVRMANDTKYGLGAYIFTKDNERFMRVALQVESGMVSQNNLSYVNVCDFFGGYKASGGGREHAKYGFHEVTQTKVVVREK